MSRTLSHQARSREVSRTRPPSRTWGRACFRLSIPLLLSVAFSTAEAFASGADFPAAVESALSESRQLRGLVYRDRVRPQWLPGGEQFWYEVATGPEESEFVWGDATSGQIRRSRDRDGLGLPAAEPQRTSEMNRRERRTSRTGPPLRVTFSNRLGRPVAMRWIDPDDRVRDYGTIPPGGEREQGTYEGHVWLLADENGGTIAVFEADPGHERIEIDGPGRGQAGGRPRGSHEERESRRPADEWRSPDGRFTVRLRDHNVEVRAADGGGPFRLTEDGTADDGYRFGVRWSPDSRTFAVTRVHLPEVRRITLMESSPDDQLQPRRQELSYAKPGDAMPRTRPVLFRLAEDEAPPFRRIDVDPDLFPNAFNESGRMDLRWSAGGEECYFDYNERGHQTYRIVAIEAATGATRAVVEERSDGFIDYTNKTWRRWLFGDRQLLWMSERDGWNHLWLYDVAVGQPLRQVTRGRWVVRGVEHVDESSQTIWFYAAGIRKGEDPYHRHLCRIRFDGSGFTQLTHGDGDHSVEWSPDRKYFVATWSRADRPPVTELRRAEDGGLVATLERADTSELLAAGWSMPERFVSSGRDGQTQIHGVIVRPQPFDPDRRYPVIEEVYAGPHGAFAPKTFGRLERWQAFSRLGFVVVQADGMGTNHRGRAFHQVAWKNLQDAGFPDRIAWIRAAAETRPWMDLRRVGIYGGSAGGQTAMRAVLDHADFYRAAAADCGCHDNRMDKRWWNEQWLGWPVDESYMAASNAEQADRLGGELLLIVGELDRNVDPASTHQVVNRLVRANKRFEFLSIPGAGHGAAESAYGQRRRLEFFWRHLGNR